MKSKMAIETTNLTKKYGDIVAVEELNLSIKEGEIFGLLGPNGSGKTTTMLMLMGLTEPTSGTISIYGFDPVRRPLNVRRLVAYLPEEARFYNNLTAKENLKYIARLNDMPKREVRYRVERELENVGLGEFGGVKLKKFSLGMKQRLGIASVLIKEPKIALLDEPTIGLDPDASYKFLETISNLSKKRKLTVFMASHTLSHVKKSCHRIGIMNKGRIMVQDTIRNLENEIGVFIKVRVSNTSSWLLKKIADIPGVQSVKEENGSLLVRCKNGLQSKIAETVVKAKITLLELGMEEVDLQDVYSKYIEGS